MIMILSKLMFEDIIAKYALYHNNCIIAAKSNRIDNTSDSSNNAFSKLVDEIERYVILQGKAYIISKLLDMLKHLIALIS